MKPEYITLYERPLASLTVAAYLSTSLMGVFQWVEALKALRLDVVGIVAVLGEGCTARTIDASSLSWHHVLPRLMPAPQALLKHERNSRLKTEDGIVVSVLAGNYSARLNHFCRLLHHEPLPRYAVEYVEVCRVKNTYKKGSQAFRAKKFGHLALLSTLGTALALILLVLSIKFRDGFALAATVLLASTSTVAGFASRWDLKLPISEPKADRADDIPDSDLVIYYPNGAFRVVRCEEEQISRLHFDPEVCKQDVGDNMYRLLALIASVFLMIGLVCMGNAQTNMQLAFAATYIFLNVCYWTVSAANPMKHHWSHDYKVERQEYYMPGEELPTQTSSNSKTETQQLTKRGVDLERNRRKVQTAVKMSTSFVRTIGGLLSSKSSSSIEEGDRFTQALWITIALAGSGQWLKNTRIAPDTHVWRKWIDFADRRARPKRNEYGHLVSALSTTKINGKIVIPPWNYHDTLTQLLQEEIERRKKRAPDPPTLKEFIWEPGDKGISLLTMIRLRIWKRRAKTRIENGTTLRLPPLSQPTTIPMIG